MAIDLNPTAQREVGEVLEQVLLAGDLAALTSEQRVYYYREVCRSLGLNELTKPFEYLSLNSKLTLYATRTATDQLREKRRVSLAIASRELIGDVYVVTARATTPDGRCDESTGCVSIKNLGGEGLANAYMKAETKAKRRVTLSIVGLGWMDESETETVRGAQRVAVDETGAIAAPAIAAPAEPAARPVMFTTQGQDGTYWFPTVDPTKREMRAQQLFDWAAATLNLPQDEIELRLGGTVAEWFGRVGLGEHPQKFLVLARVLFEAVHADAPIPGAPAAFVRAGEETAVAF